MSKIISVFPEIPLLSELHNIIKAVYILRPQGLLPKYNISKYLDKFEIYKFILHDVFEELMTPNALYEQITII